MVHYCKKIVCELICFTSSRKITFLTLSIISGLLAIPLIAIASFGQMDALGPWDVGNDVHNYGIGEYYGNTGSGVFKRGVHN